MKLGLLTTNGLRVLAVVLGVPFIGYLWYRLETAPPDRWEESLQLDQDLAEAHCNNDYACQEDLRVALRGCIAVYEHEGSDATYSCQYRYMAKLGVRPPAKGTDGRWHDANLDEISARVAHTAQCMAAHPIVSKGTESGTAEVDAEIDAMTKCLANFPPRREP